MLLLQPTKIHCESRIDPARWVATRYRVPPATARTIAELAGIGGNAEVNRPPLRSPSRGGRR